jgi:type VI protein secretion system component VasF
MLIKGVEWNETETWQTTPLEEHVFGSAIAYKEYFRRAQLVEEQGEGGDAIEMYFVCVLLGFQGMYAARSTDELADWVAARGQFVERTRQRASGTKEMAPKRRIRTATPFSSRAFLVWPWVLLAVTIGLNALYYLWPIT